MLFHSIEFMTLLAITFSLYYLFPKKRILLLAIANMIFYGVSGVRYLVIFVFVSFITYFCSRKLDSKHGKIYFYIALLVNILNLTFFKYTGFLLENFEKALNLSFPWKDAFLIQIILPVGISFYTFQLIAYLVDVKRKDIKPSESFVVFWVFISFFAQLIAGPIMRGNEFLPQVRKALEYKFDLSRFKLGMYYILRGFIKKMIFADTLAPMVVKYYSNAAAMSTLDAWYATYLFAFQIFFDFSAYSEFAIGIGHLFGFQMDINFKTPYISANPKEFWKRWHITLSSWIRDYIYIPLGGNRRGFVQKCVYLLLAMTISGLWHGAKWTFIIWGAYHGMLSVFHSLYIKYFAGIKEKLSKSIIYRVLTIFIFFQLVNIGWVFFRANTLSDALLILKKMFNFTNIHITMNYVIYFSFVIFLYIIHVAEYVMNTSENKIGRSWSARVPSFIRAAVYAVIIMLLIFFISGEKSTFIYFQF